MTILPGDLVSFNRGEFCMVIRSKPYIVTQEENPVMYAEQQSKNFFILLLLSCKGRLHDGYILPAMSLIHR